ncbi:hypothetical protein [Pseudactinotalea terrae]|uniref:hypothetical protein n=1 Tax=Pseudactinotalea terrae TaxID=1743262 RepID=UPI0012E1EF65|nr:hypothetical protein [Pseudactinotalea terrae]
MTLTPITQPRHTDGRFATVTRLETPVRLQDGPTSLKLYELASDLVTTTQMGETDTATAKAKAMEVLGELPDAEQVWDGIRTAAERWVWFEDEDYGDERAGELLEEETKLDVDLEDFAGWNEADRHDEDGYLGYDFRGYADALADAWRTELEHRTRLAEQALSGVRLAS